MRIDSFAYTNRLATVPPGQKLIFTLVNLALALGGSPQTQGLLILWLGFWIVGYAGIPRRAYLRSLSLGIVFGLASLPALVLGWGACSTDAYWLIPWSEHCLYWSISGTHQAGLVLLRMIAALSCFYFLIFTVPLPAIVKILCKVGLPTELAEIILLMYRFIFTLIAQVNQAWLAQQARWGYSSWQRSMYSFSLLVQYLFRAMFEQYERSRLAIAARGPYHLSEPRQTYQTRWDYLGQVAIGWLVLLLTF